MRLHRIVLAALALAVLAPAAAEAQVNIVTARRGVLGFASELTFGPNGEARRVIVDVVRDSPAEKAGVMVGDTVLRFNGLQPVGEVLSALQPGDTVVLRLRRNGAERNVSVVAAPRSTEFVSTFNVLPDSIRRSVAVMVDAVRAGIDTVMFPRIRVERIHGDSVIVLFGQERLLAAPRTWNNMSADSVRNIFIHRAGEVERIFGDSAFYSFRIGADSLAAFARPGRFMLRGDSAGFMIRTDSGRVRVFGAAPGAMSFTLDSLHSRMFTLDSIRGMTWSLDSVRGMRPTELMSAHYAFGLRAIAGAELSELNPALGEYFGTLEGVLVLNAHESTPAGRAGLRSGDVIVRANGEPVTSIASLRRAVAERPRSSTTLEVLRRGTRLTVELGRQ